MNTQENSPQVSIDDYVRIAVVGNVDSGKSTLVGVLTKNLLDDGRGSSRVRVFNFAHESETGRTSSIVQEIIGFDADGKQVVPDRFVQSKNKYWMEVAPKSKKIVSLVDLCGHEKYLKTTILGLVGLVPDFVMIIVGSNLGLSKMTKEHLGIALALKIPFFIVMTKIDMVDEEIVKETTMQISKLMSTSVVNKKAILIKNCKSSVFKNLKEKVNDVEKVVTDIKNISIKKDDTKKTENHVPMIEIPSVEDELLEKTVGMLMSETICPIFQISSVTGEGINELLRFFYLIKSRSKQSKIFGDQSAPIEFDVHECFNVVGVGLVVSGLLKSGIVEVGSQMILGPDKDNGYKPVVVKSIHFNRMVVEKGHPGQFLCFNIKMLKKKEDITRAEFRKGMVLLDQRLNPKYAVGFQAEIAVLHHSTTIKVGYECVMHCGVIRQSVRITNMDRELLRTGDNAIITFKFNYNQEYLKPDLPFLLREGRTKIVGRVTQVFYSDSAMPEDRSRQTKI